MTHCVPGDASSTLGVTRMSPFCIAEYVKISISMATVVQTSMTFSPSIPTIEMLLKLSSFLR